MTTDRIDEISTPPGGRPVFRRTHHKPDGRLVRLYGYERPEGQVVPGGLENVDGKTELRWHPLRGEWNTYASARQNRTFRPGAAMNPLAPSRPGGPTTEIPFEDFELAIFDNRFPSFKETPNTVDAEGAGLKKKPALGKCDVVVYSPEAEGSLASLSQDRRSLLVHAWIDRYAALFRAGLDTVLPFENRGEEVGVTLPHPHGQIYGFDFTPPVQAAAVRAFNDGFDLSPNLMDWRADFGIADTGDFLAFAPPFARFPYEVWIAPFKQQRGPWEFTAPEIDVFAHLLGDITRRYDHFFGRPTPYMLSLHAAPKSAGKTFHFSAQFYPILRAPDRIKYLACVEQATGVFTIDILPETTAKRLRNL